MTGNTRLLVTDEPSWVWEPTVWSFKALGNDRFFQDESVEYTLKTWKITTCYKDPIGLGNTLVLTDYAQQTMSQGHFEKMRRHFGLGVRNIQFAAAGGIKKLGKWQACQLVLDFLPWNAFKQFLVDPIVVRPNVWSILVAKQSFVDAQFQEFQFSWLGKFEMCGPCAPEFLGGPI